MSFKNVFVLLSAKILIVLALSSLLILSCDDNIIDTDKQIIPDEFEFTPESEYSDHYGVIHLEKSKSERYITGLPDYLDIDTIISTRDWSIYASAQFGKVHNDQIDFIKINNEELEEAQFASGGYYYSKSDIPVNYDGKSNNIHWSIKNVTYSANINMNSSDFVLTNPTFMQRVDKSQGLTITWEPSPDPNDFVHIILQGRTELGDKTEGEYSVGYLNEYAEDSGSFIISPSKMNEYNEPKANLMIYRIKKFEQVIKDKTYLITQTTIYSTEIIFN